VAYISYICHFEPVWCDAWCTLHRHHETRERYRLHGTPARRHTGFSKGSKHQLRIEFWSFRHVVQGFRHHILYKVALLMLRESVFPRRPYVEGCIKVICFEKTCIRIPLTRRHRKARLELTIKHTRWTMQHSLMSPGSA
jgi:hypothetical protein